MMISDGYYDRLAQIESGNNPNAKNPNSSAAGLYQFIESTAKQYDLDDPYDPVKARTAVEKLTADNYRALQSKLGRAPTEGELYLAHQQGAGGALKLLLNANAKAYEVVGTDQVLNNGGSKDMSAKDFASKWTSKFDLDLETSGSLPTSTVTMAQKTPAQPEFTKEEILAEIERRKAMPTFSKQEIIWELSRRQAQEARKTFEQTPLLERIGQAAVQREWNIQQDRQMADQSGYGFAGSLLPMAGEAAGFIGDVGFEVFKSAADLVFNPEIQEEAGALANYSLRSVMETAPAKFVSQEYQAFKKSHPLLAENIEGGASTALFVVPTAAYARSGTANAAGASAVARKAPTNVGMVGDEVAQAARSPVFINRNRRALHNILKSSDKSYQEILDTLKSSDILTIADVAGDEVQGLTRALSKMEDAKNVIHGTLTQRSLDSVRRVSNELSKSVSSVDNYFNNIDELGKARSAAARPLYKRAFEDATEIADPRLTKFLEDKRVIDAMDVAKKSYGVRLEAASNSLETLDGVKKVLYDIESKARRAGEDNLSIAYKGLRQDLVDILDEASPTYRQARKVYETPSRMIDAQTAGRNFDKLQPEEITKALSGMEPHELDAYRIGVRQKLQQIVNTTPDGADPGRRIFGNTQKRAQIEAVMGDNKAAFQEFSKRIEDEIQTFKTRNTILGGSRTDYNLAADDSFIDAVADTARRGVVVTTKDKIFEATIGAFKRHYYGISDKNARELAEIMVDRDKGIAALQELVERQRDFQQRAIVGQAIKNHAPVILADPE